MTTNLIPKIRASVQRHLHYRNEFFLDKNDPAKRGIQFIRPNYRHTDAEKQTIQASIATELGSTIVSCEWHVGYRWGFGTIEYIIVRY